MATATACKTADLRPARAICPGVDFPHRPWPLPCSPGSGNSAVRAERRASARPRPPSTATISRFRNDPANALAAVGCSNATCGVETRSAMIPVHTHRRACPVCPSLLTSRQQPSDNGCLDRRKNTTRPMKLAVVAVACWFAVACGSSEAGGHGRGAGPRAGNGGCTGSRGRKVTGCSR